jgi:hypothetical protein
MSATPAPQPAPTQAQLDAVLQAALYLLGARQDRMLTIEEWTDLARAVAACQERKTADYLTEHDLEDIAERYALEWDEATDGPLPTLDESEAFITPCSQPRRSSCGSAWPSPRSEGFAGGGCRTRWSRWARWSAGRWGRGSAQP